VGGSGTETRHRDSAVGGSGTETRHRIVQWEGLVLRLGTG